MMFVRPDQVNEPLYVVTTVFNPVRYRTRWKLYCDFANMVKAAGAKLLTVEVAFGERDFALDNLEHDYYVQLRTSNILWHKESALNIGFSRLPNNWKYAAHIDADILFARDDWDNEIVHKLQDYPIIQIFSQSVDLSPNYDILKMFRSYAWCISKGYTKDQTAYDEKGIYFHPGYGMAFRREAFDQLGGLIDWGILGGGDLFMMNALFDHNFKLPKSLGESGKKWMSIWKARADKYIKQNVGYMDGLILHFWHGKKISRKYNDRGSILIDAQFDPEIDLKRDYQGLWQLNDENIKLRDGIRNYFGQRNEDGIDV